MRFNSIDDKLSILGEDLKVISKELDFSNHYEFILDQNFTKSHIQDLDFPGVYLLEIKKNGEKENFKDWVENFQSIWLGENNCFEKCYTPSIKKKRINSHIELHEWIPIYIGKSKNIKNRISEHFFKKLNQTTFALKLLERENLFGNSFRISVIKIEVKNYDIIMPIIESELRNKINPILGRQ